MDIPLLVGLLTPYLPFFLGLGQKAIEKGAEKLGEKEAEVIWQKLFPKIEAKQAAQEAVEDVAKNPDDGDAIAALRNQLKKILEAPENTALAAEVAQILESTTIKSVATGKFNINAEGSNIGNIGDHGKAIMTFGQKP
jgi:hypothetical protein